MSNAKFKALISEIPSKRRRFVRMQGDLAVQIHTVLEAKGWSQRDLAREAGKKESYISRLVSGGGNPTLRTLAAVSDALDSEILIAPMFADSLADSKIVYQDGVLTLHVRDEPVTERATVREGVVLHLNRRGEVVAIVVESLEALATLLVSNVRRPSEEE